MRLRKENGALLIFLMEVLDINGLNLKKMIPLLYMLMQTLIKHSELMIFLQYFIMSSLLKMELDSDEEYEPVSSGFNIRKSMKRSDRRKNTKPWTLDEVAALINGMSQFGTGQWTSVKRAFFSSSSRTATDISDKWRNLVKKNIQISKAGKDDQHQWNGSQPFPKTLMCYESSPFIQYLYCFGKEKKKTEKGTKTKRKEKRGFCDFRFSQHQLDQVVDRRSSRGPILLKFGELVLDI
ncbi:uncharacterized protein LOC130813258 isoform X3 [Amaranthus tricolor]|uniref:uncharacterized protein LOC130813258 isoform X3 n=2 Tax=Amaranthus tricolor TaxID=29722 RepID=UPI0025845514|nr:uncharacterized protein LOC130813258 isoform X3 [Amaranthus tricolor]